MTAVYLIVALLLLWLAYPEERPRIKRERARRKRKSLSIRIPLL